MTRALAHPNIALVKYWGKQNKTGNMPATPNLSITLSELTAVTTISDSDRFRFRLNGQQVNHPKVSALIATMTDTFSLPPLQIDSTNNFPTSAGLASSAAGFAALVTGIDAHCHLGMDAALRSEWARRGSASAARSICGGFVALVPPDWQAQSLAPTNHWPLEVVVAVTSHEAKAVSSSEGMERSRLTSPFYNQWLRSAGDDYAEAALAIATRDFEKLATVAELSCLKMHSLMLTSSPTLSYWTPASVACMDRIRELRNHGEAVFFTVDAGPQIKAVCLPESRVTVAKALSEVPGVLEILSCSAGEGARIIDDEEPLTARCS